MLFGKKKFQINRFSLTSHLCPFLSFILKNFSPFFFGYLCWVNVTTEGFSKTSKFTLI